MRVEVELHPDVHEFLWKVCNHEQRVAFEELRREIERDPFGCSRPISIPELSRYVLRGARFDEFLVVFDLDRSRKKVCIRRCRRLSRKNKSTPPNGSNGD